jgi:hypothetical protein
LPSFNVWRSMARKNWHPPASSTSGARKVTRLHRVDCAALARVVLHPAMGRPPPPQRPCRSAQAAAPRLRRPCYRARCDASDHRLWAARSAAAPALCCTRSAVLMAVRRCRLSQRRDRPGDICERAESRGLCHGPRVRPRGLLRLHGRIDRGDQEPAGAADVPLRTGAREDERGCLRLASASQPPACLAASPLPRPPARSDADTALIVSLAALPQPI